MSIQDQISRATRDVRYTLMDNNIYVKGRSIHVVRFQVTKDMYDDETVTFIKKDKIEVILNYPGEIPLYRFSRNNYDQSVEDTGVFFFDILPIDIFTKWKDKVIKGDYIFHSLKDEEDNPIEILLKISEVVGRFDSERLIWRKGWCSPYNGAIPEELQEAIDEERSFEN